jgi:superfamily II DNA helicase RecQ
LNYFGEQDPPLCGICDYCQNKNGQLSLEEVQMTILEKIQQHGNELSIDKILQFFPKESEKKVNKAVQRLIENEKLTFSNGILHRHQ